jgi:hypothetical protein
LYRYWPTTAFIIANKAREVLRNPESFKKTISNNGKPSAEFGRRFSDGTIVVAKVETAEDGAVAVKQFGRKYPTGFMQMEPSTQTVRPKTLPSLVILMAQII